LIFLGPPVRIPSTFTTGKLFSVPLEMKYLMFSDERFVESMNNPSKDPIAFWTNGGPGKLYLFQFKLYRCSYFRFVHNPRMLRSSWFYDWTSKIHPHIFIYTLLLLVIVLGTIQAKQGYVSQQ
jgi:hypothetical protein